MKNVNGIQGLKTDLHWSAARLRRNRALLRDGVPFSQARLIQATLAHDSWIHRHKHVAYCLARGRTLRQVERYSKRPLDPQLLARVRFDFALRPHAQRPGLVSRIAAWLWHGLTSVASSKST